MKKKMEKVKRQLRDPMDKRLMIQVGYPSWIQVSYYMFNQVPFQIRIRVEDELESQIKKELT
jgi:hypothetical protein